MGMKGQAVIRHRSLWIPAISHKFLVNLMQICYTTCNNPAVHVRLHILNRYLY